MSSPVPDSDVTRLKHVDLIQAVISRQAGNSFLLKGWAVTLSAAIFGFAADHLNWRVAAVGLLPAVAFGALDAYYLYQERLFRCLYGDAISTDAVAPLSLDTRPYRGSKARKTRARDVVRSPVIWPFYLVLIAAGLLLTGLSAANSPTAGLPLNQNSTHPQSHAPGHP